MVTGPRAYALLRANAMSHAQSLALILRTMRCRFLRKTDTQRWTDLRNFDPAWDQRTQVIASLIPQCSRIIEFGAGRERLRTYLDGTCTYTPADLVKRSSNTVVFDLNKRPLPDLRALNLDVAIFGGVLEYIADIGDVPRWLARQVSLCIASYECATSGLSPAARALEVLSRSKNGWMNHYGEKQLKELFCAGGFTFDRKVNWGLPETGGNILVFRKN